MLHPLRLFKREDVSSGALSDFFQSLDPNRAVGEDGANVEPASHGANDVAQRAEIHVRAALQFGDGGLPDFQLRGQRSLHTEGSGLGAELS